MTPPFFRCFGCGHRDELRLSIGQVELGYLYAAGTAHFAGMEERPLPGLRVKPGRKGLEVEYQGTAGPSRQGAEPHAGLTCARSTMPS
ncbi:hypothetical protein [Deinococcus sp.]|uniref:hypothetical protein n=1 Tax=Deinococcus sp. TaxID=47478 RepID=UPI003C79F708